jgi:4-aminobutyrate aminotransferase
LALIVTFTAPVEGFTPVTKTPSAALTKRWAEKSLGNGLILLTCGVYGNVIRFLAPITIQDGVMNEALDILESSIREVRVA